MHSMATLDHVFHTCQNVLQKFQGIQIILVSNTENSNMHIYIYSWHICEWVDMECQDSHVCRARLYFSQ